MLNDRPTIDWLRRQALTVLAELMTSDDDRIALRAAQVTLSVFKQCGAQEDEKEKRIVVRYGDNYGDKVPTAHGAGGDTPKLRPVPRGGLRATLGQDRSGEDRGA